MELVQLIRELKNDKENYIPVYQNKTIYQINKKALLDSIRKSILKRGLKPIYPLTLKRYSFYWRKHKKKERKDSSSTEISH